MNTWGGLDSSRFPRDSYALQSRALCRAKLDRMLEAVEYRVHLRIAHLNGKPPVRKQKRCL